MMTRAGNHPSPVRDMIKVRDTRCARKRKKSDVKGVTTRSRAVPAEYRSTKLYKLRNQQKKHP